MPTVRFYASFSKKRNSTKRPSNSSSDTVVTCSFKEDTSIKNPVLIFKGQKFDANYCYIADTLSYYYVEDIISRTKYETEYHLKLDVLATYRTQIGSTVARIAFSSTGYNTELVDNRINVSTLKSIYRGAVTTMDVFDENQNGYFVLSVVNNVGTNIGNGYGFATTYALTPTAMANFRQIFAYTAFPTAVQEMFGGNMMNAIISCLWVPFDTLPTGCVSTGGTISILTENLTGIGDVYLLPSDSSIEKVYSVAFPDTDRYTDFRRIEPYSTGQIFLPGVGSADICMADWVMCTSIDVDTVIDFATGDISYYLRNPNNHTILQTFTTNVAADCPVGHVQRNMSGAMTGIAGAATGIVTTVIGIATENAVMAAGGAASAIGSAAASVLSYNKRAVSLKGGISGKTSAYFTGSFINLYKVITEDPDDANYIAKKGRPVCLTHAINTHSGYVECDDASVALKASDIEIQEVNSYLNSGFYYE